MTPNDPDAWRGLAAALLGLEKYGGAATAFEQTLVLLPEDCQALEGLAAACEALGESDKAAACRIRLGELS